MVSSTFEGGSMKPIHLVPPAPSSELLQHIQDFFTGVSASLHSSFLCPTLNGKQLYEYAETGKDNLQVMSQCCQKATESAIANNNVPAPFYFYRAAVIAKKDMMLK